jgi:exosortase
MLLENHQQSESAADPKSALATPPATTAGKTSCLKWILVFAPIGYLWFRLINNLRPEWTTNPQYSYGWVVPFLCVGLLLRRWSAAQESRKQKAESRNQLQISAFQRFSVSAFASRFQLSAFPISAFCLLAFMYLPTRLIEEATPEWRPIQWALGFEAVGLTLCAVYLGKGRGWLRQVAFPVCFFFVAIPWPTVIEQPLIQSLTRINSAITVEVLSWIGIPAMQHGNLIEVGTGTVGVSEACSGIRSFQTTLMISLFFGEFYRMALARRLILIPAGFILAMAFNVCRMSFLTMIAAKKGVAAIAQYHDPAGVAITITCTLVLWGMSLLLINRKVESRKQKSESCDEIGNQKSEIKNEFQLSAFQISAFHSEHFSFLLSKFQLFGLALLVWLIAVEGGTELWYRNLESHLAPSPKWTAAFPINNPTFKTLPMDANTEYLLRFDEGRQGEWQEADGSRWQAFYFNWFPGRVAGYLAKRHTPEACLPAAGWKLLSGPDLMVMSVKNIELPMRHYVFENAGNSLQVFQCRWEAGMSQRAYVQDESSEFNLIRGIWAGRGKYGQKVLEIIVTGYPDADQAKAAVARQLQTLIKVES